MKPLHNIARLLGSLVIALALVGCEDDNYMRFDSAYNGIYFLTRKADYSFGVSPLSQQTYILNVPLRVMGSVTSTERPFAYEVVPTTATADTLPAEVGVQCRILPTVVMPDSVRAYLPVEIVRSALEGNYIDGYKRYRLVLRLTEGAFFRPTLDSLAQQVTLTFDNAVEQPEWYDFRGDKVWSTASLGQWHPLKLIKMVEYFHQLADTQPETYEKMVAAYGENLEHIPYGDPYLYRTIMRKYVYAPMSAYFAAPENREEILRAYPDFPFDFPDYRQ